MRIPSTAAPVALAALALLLTLSACAGSRESRIASALTDAGLGRDLALCMAKPIARDLDSGQLRSLQRLARLSSDRVEKMTGRQMLDTLRDSNLDPDTVAVVTRASLGCFLRG